MIHDQDRSGWFGASDTAKIMGRWDTKTFELFWREKLGLWRNTYKSIEMETGTHLEGRILDELGIRRRDRQIRIPELRLRVNLDGETFRTVHEVKTHKKLQFVVSRPYWMQAQVEMFASKKYLEINAYRVEPEDYDNWLRRIDPDRLSRHPVSYDYRWVRSEYLPRIQYLSSCLREGRWPEVRA